MTDIGFSPQVAMNYGRAKVVTPSDTLPNVFSALYIGSAGDVAVIPQGQTTAVTFKAVPVGILPIAVSRVMAANTASTSIIGLGGTSV